MYLFLNDPAPPEIYPLSLHDALPSSGPGDRQARPPRRPVAQPLQVAVPARPGLVRPPALPEVSGHLAGLLAQGQDRRLARSEEHTSELQSRQYLVCRLLLEKKTSSSI